MADHKYVNAVIYNSTSQEVDAVVNINRAGNIIDKPSDYSLAVARFESNVESIPIFNFQDNYFKLLFSYTSDINDGNAIVQTLIFTPFNQNNPSDVGVYTYPQLLDMVNDALSTAWASISGLFGWTVNPPVMTYSASTGLFSLTNIPIEVRNGVSGGGADLYFNQPLQSLFPTFNYERIFEFPAVPFGSEGDAYKVVCDAASITQWTCSNTSMIDCRGFVITSDTLPIIPEITNFDSTSTQITSNFASLDTTNILIDLLFPFKSSANESTPMGIGYIQYFPSLYRTVDLTGDKPIKSIKLNFYWVNKKGQLFPLRILPDNTLSIKLAFIKKQPVNKVS